MDKLKCAIYLSVQWYEMQKIPEKVKKGGESAQKSRCTICYSDESVKKTLLKLCKCDSIRQDVGNVTENDSKVMVFFREEHMKQKIYLRKKEV